MHSVEKLRGLSRGTDIEVPPVLLTSVDGASFCPIAILIVEYTGESDLWIEKFDGSPEMTSCMALNLNSHGLCKDTRRGISSMREPVLGRSKRRVVLWSLVASRSADSLHPHLDSLSVTTGPVEGGDIDIST